MKIYVVFHVVESDDFCCDVAKSTGHGYIQKAFTTREKAEKFRDWLKGQVKYCEGCDYAIKEITLD